MKSRVIFHQKGILHACTRAGSLCRASKKEFFTSYLFCLRNRGPLKDLNNSKLIISDRAVISFSSSGVLVVIDCLSFFLNLQIPGVLWHSTICSGGTSGYVQRGIVDILIGQSAATQNVTLPRYNARDNNRFIRLKGSL